MAKMDFSKFKKISSDKHTTTLKHPHGHEITIVHSALSPSMRGDLAAIPVEGHKAKKPIEPVMNPMAKGGEVKDPTQEHLLPGDSFPNEVEKQVVDKADDSLNRMADGGEVETTPAAQPEEVAAPAPPQQAPVVINVGTNQQQPPQIPEALANPTPGAQAAQQNPSPQPVAAPTTPPTAQSTPANPMQQSAGPSVPASAEQSPQQSQDPYGTGAANQIFSQGLGQEQAGIKGQYEAEKGLGGLQQQALQKQHQQMELAKQVYSQHYNELDSERQALQKDIQNGHIDPQRLMNAINKDEASKIQTAFGLILGGIGGAMTHQENPALAYLNKQVENDINAQKADLGKKENLLSANLHQFGNMRDATDMTRIMQNDLIKSQMELAAAKATDPAAKARMLQAIGQFNMNNAAQVGQMAMRKTLLTGMQMGQIPPERIVEALVPKDEKPEALKELTAAQNLVKGRDNFANAFDQIAEMQTLGGRLSNPLQAGQRIEALKQPIVAQLSKETAGKFSEQDAKMLDTLFPTLRDDAETLATKRAAAMRLLNEKANFPRLKFYGIDVSKQGQSKIQESAPIVGK